MVANLNQANSFLIHKPSPKIYVACLASYTDGKLHGRWIDATLELKDILTKIKRMLADSPMPHAEEYAIHDFEGFYSLRIDEYETIEAVHEKACFISEHGELGAKLLAYYQGEVGAAKSAMNDRYQGAYKDKLDYASQLFDELLLHRIPDGLHSYIDYELFARDIFIDDCFSIDVQGCCHVFTQ